MTDYLNMSDEDFAKQSIPSASEGEASTGDASQTQTETDASAGTADASAQAAGEGGTTQTDQGLDTSAQTGGAEGTGGTSEEEDPPAPGATSPSGSVADSDAAKGQGADGGTSATNGKTPDASTSAQSNQGQEGGVGGTPTTTSAPATEAPLDYKAIVERLLAPFKANGKTIQLKNPDEVLSLMQQGANYGAKMQAIAPHRKVLTMLENNGLLDESQLSLLIDVHKRNPEAIKKFLKDAGINPMDIDMDTAPAYTGGSNVVSDDEVQFNTVLTEVGSSAEGQKTIQVMNSTWDKTSKELLWKEPQIMAIIHTQRESGVYDRIAAEVDRQKAIGTIPANVPFLHAYKAVGEQLHASGALGASSAMQPTTAQAGATPAAVVATRAAAPRTQVKSNDKAAAASTSRTTPQKAKAIVNPLSMSDDEFLAQMSNRL